VHPQIVRLPSCLGGVPLPSYGVLLLFAAALGIGLAVRLGRRDRLAGWDVVSVGLLALAGGLAGAGLLDLLVNLPTRRGAGLPGLAFFGGLLGGGAAALLFIRAYRLPLAALADVGAVCLPLAHAVGRVGCFLGGCCFGRPAPPPWPGVIFTDPLAPAARMAAGQPLHPVQLYEAGFLLLLGGALLLARHRGWWRGRLFLVYLALYALGRLGLEGLRGDPGRGGLGPLSTSQIMALLVLAVLPLLWRQASRARIQNSPK
jgi:phosphatidylglycerol:prolipoprotein diacylglycerol transferase